MSLIKCPNCGSEDWNAVEQISSVSKCRISKNDNGVEVEVDPMSEFVRDASTSVTVAYACAADCGFVVPADQVGGL